MLFLFCNNGFDHREVDYFYVEEYHAAKAKKIPTALFSLEELRRGAITEALRYVPVQATETTVVYRGWMLKPTQYQALYTGLLDKKLRLLNSPEQYVFCHHLPKSYKVLQGYTPKTTFKKLEGKFHYNDFASELAVFADQPIIVKDYVKSQKHYWKEACYIPDASNRVQATAVIERFLELQAEDLNEGLVFREFVPLEQLTTHSKSGMPLTKEFRLFVYKEKVISVFNYWDEGDYQTTTANWNGFQALLQEVKSNFFTMDIAQTTTGNWIVIELGDAQVSGLPDNADKVTFIENIQTAMML